MPLYDYKCADGHIFEVLQSWSADPVATCGECGKAGKRQMSVPMVLYKGSGFYTTDYGRNSSSNGSGRNGDSDSKANGEAKSSSDSGAKASKSSKSEKSSKSSAKSD